MPLYFVRHSQTDWNVEHRVQGRVDIPLNAEGIAKAKALYEKTKDLPFDAIYTSPLSRAYATAEILKGDRDIPLIADERLVEISFGEMEGVKTNDPTYCVKLSTFTERFPQGESLLEVAYRVYGFLHEMEEKHSRESILVVGHGGIARIVDSYFHDKGNEEFIAFLPPNCELIAYDWPHRKIPVARGDSEHKD